MLWQAVEKAVPARVIATASEAWREAIQTFFRFFAAFTDSGGIFIWIATSLRSSQGQPQRFSTAC